MMCNSWEEALCLGWEGILQFEELIRLDFKGGDTQPRGDCLLH